MTIDHRRTALITGASKGIGLAIARQVGAQGHSVWLGCRDAQRGESAARALQRAGIDARVVQRDVVDEASVAKAAALPTESCEQLDILLNGLMVVPQPLGAEQTVQQAAAAGVVAGLARRHERADRVSVRIGYGVQLGVQAVVGASDQPPEDVDPISWDEPSPYRLDRWLELWRTLDLLVCVRCQCGRFRNIAQRSTDLSRSRFRKIAPVGSRFIFCLMRRNSEAGCAGVVWMPVK